MNNRFYAKLGFIGASVALTLGIHYGWILEPIFGHTAWVHAIHGRFCYIPIVIAASWFGIRGGLITAVLVGLLVTPLLITGGYHGTLVGELVEIVFYFAIAILTGGLVDREFSLRQKQVQTERELDQAKHLSMIGQMAAGVAHEIKNPLASIKGAAEIFSDTRTGPDERDEFGRIISSEIKRIDSTVGEFLTFARPPKIELRKTDLSALAQSSIQQFETQAAKAGIVIAKEITPDVFVNGDSDKLHQIILNLLLNSLEAIEGEGKISIWLGIVDDNKVLLKIRDTGAGIPGEMIDRIFDPFFTTKSSGTGLGLAIVKSIIDQHGGKIECSSSSEGTTFELSLNEWRAS